MEGGKKNEAKRPQRGYWPDNDNDYDNVFHNATRQLRAMSTSFVLEDAGKKGMALYQPPISPASIG